MQINPAELSQLWAAFAMFILGIVQGYSLAKRKRKE